MNLIERQEAYRAIKERYNLRARQRDVLDASEKLNEMLEFAHKGRWTYLTILLESEGIFDAREYMPVTQPSFEL